MRKRNFSLLLLVFCAGCTPLLAKSELGSFGEAAVFQGVSEETVEFQVAHIGHNQEMDYVVGLVSKDESFSPLKSYEALRTTAFEKDDRNVKRTEKVLAGKLKGPLYTNHRFYVTSIREENRRLVVDVDLVGDWRITAPPGEATAFFLIRLEKFPEQIQYINLQFRYFNQGWDNQLHPSKVTVPDVSLQPGRLKR